MSYEIFHLAADGCKVQVILQLSMHEAIDNNPIKADVVLCTSTSSDASAKCVIDALQALHPESYITHIDWDAELQVRPLLKLGKNTIRGKIHQLLFRLIPSDSAIKIRTFKSSK